MEPHLPAAAGQSSLQGKKKKKKIKQQQQKKPYHKLYTNSAEHLTPEEDEGTCCTGTI